MAEKNDLEIAEQKRKAALQGGEGQAKKMVAALLRERAGLVQQDKDDRVAQVDEQLRHYGVEPPSDEATEPRVSEDPKKQAPQGRSATPPKQQTKD